MLKLHGTEALVRFYIKRKEIGSAYRAVKQLDEDRRKIIKEEILSACIKNGDIDNAIFIASDLRNLTEDELMKMLDINIKKGRFITSNKVAKLLRGNLTQDELEEIGKNVKVDVLEDVLLWINNDKVKMNLLNMAMDRLDPLDRNSAEDAIKICKLMDAIQID